MPRGTSDTDRAVVRDFLTSSSWVPLWHEARARAAAARVGSRAQRQWREALTQLEAAMQATEALAPSIDPSLGRRRWTSRPGNPTVTDLVPPQRQGSGNLAR